MGCLESGSGPTTLFGGQLLTDPLRCWSARCLLLHRGYARGGPLPSGWCPWRIGRRRLAPAFHHRSGVSFAGSVGPAAGSGGSWWSALSGCLGWRSGWGLRAQFHGRLEAGVQMAGRGEDEDGGASGTDRGNCESYFWVSCWRRLVFCVRDSLL